MNKNIKTEIPAEYKYKTKLNKLKREAKLKPKLKSTGESMVKMQKAFDRKNNGKGSDYKPGTRVPAVEESLMKKDKELA